MKTTTKNITIVPAAGGEVKLVVDPKEGVYTNLAISEKAPVMVAHEPGQGLCEQRDLPPHPACRQDRHGLWVGSPRNQGVQHRASRDTHHV